MVQALRRERALLRVPFPAPKEVWSVHLSWFEVSRLASNVTSIGLAKSKVEYDLVRPSFPITGDATSDECVEFAQALITECLENHTECSSPISSRRTRPSNTNIMRQLQRGMRDLLHKDDPVTLPTRLLDIGALGADHIRLIKTSSSPSPEGALYACLSHCWGPSQPLTTTTSTLADRKISDDMTLRYATKVSSGSRISWSTGWEKTHSCHCMAAIFGEMEGQG